MNSADVLIVGGGISGCAAAIALRKKGIENVIVLERTKNALIGLGETIPGAVRSLLANWGLSHLTDGHSRSSGSMSAWGSASFETRDAFAEAAGAGWHLDRLRFESDLKKAAISAGVTFYSVAPAQRVTYKEKQDDWYVSIHGTNESISLSSRIIVDATGTTAGFARQQGSHRVKCDELVAVAVWFNDTAISQSRAFTLLETMPYGWWYTSALPGNKRVCILFSDADILRESELLTKGNWFKALAQTDVIKELCIEENMTGTLVKRSAASGFMWPAAGDKWLATGDALYSVDPLSSSGIYNALQTADDAAETIIQMLQGNKEAAMQYGQKHRKRFEQYMAKRFDYYRLEKRWPESSFWRRRYGHITLPPSAIISAPQPGGNKTVGGYLSMQETAYLYSLCTQPATAGDVIRMFMKKYNDVSERLVILTLQELLAKAKPEDADIKTYAKTLL